jgi:hypothetical protein
MTVETSALPHTGCIGNVINNLSSVETSALPHTGCIGDVITFHALLTFAHSDIHLNYFEWAI